MSAEAAVAEKKTSPTAAPRILIVEDERIVARSLKKQLTALGYDVVASVPSGEAAIQQARKLRPDLTLMDINLEGDMDGVEAAAAIRSRFQIPVVYLTAYSNSEILERAKVTEPFGYILKPYADRELHVVIETALYKHHAERRRQEREPWFAATLSSVAEAVVAADDDGHVTYMNAQAESLTGWDSRDALGHQITDVVRIVDAFSRQPVDSPLDLVMRAGAPSGGTLLIAKDRSETAVESCISLIADEKGVALGGVMVIRDVTWRKRLDEQIRKTHKQEAIGRLAGGVAHSLNNLMTAVLGHSELMLAGMKAGDPFFVNASEIQKAATRTAQLTSKLLAFSRKAIVTPLPLDLNAVIRGLARITQELQGGIRFDLLLEPELGITMADRNQVEEAILTLARNACESMPNGGRVIIETDNVVVNHDSNDDHPEIAPGHYVALAVSDAGFGMNAAAIAQLFEPFNTNDSGVGRGLGLAAIYGFVKQCGGGIEVQSQVGKGTIFRIYLPRCDVDASSKDLLA